MPIRSERRDFIVPADLDGRPLDGAVKKLIGSSWGQARELVLRGKVLLGDAVVTEAEHRVRAGDALIIDPRAPARKRRSTLDRSALLHVDTHVVVVNKPPHVSTVAFEAGERDTLDQVVAVLVRRASDTGPTPSLGVVQRLDKETSGLIVFARTFGAKKALAQQLRLHTVHRSYLAIAHGRVSAGTLRSYLVKDRGDGLRGASRHGREGQLAVTHVKPLETLKGATLVSCRLETGRTHQIRVHLAEAGHPLLGERVYVRGYGAELLAAPRVMLHAAELGFAHPIRGHAMRFEIAPPADFEEVLTALRLGRR